MRVDLLAKVVDGGEAMAVSFVSGGGCHPRTVIFEARRHYCNIPGHGFPRYGDLQAFCDKIGYSSLPVLDFHSRLCYGEMEMYSRSKFMPHHFCPTINT